MVWNRTLKVLYAATPPMVNSECGLTAAIRASPHCVDPGFCVEIMRTIARTMGIRIEPVVASNDVDGIASGGEVNGHWTGALGLIYNGTVDTACMLYPASRRKTEHFDLSEPVYWAQTRVLIRQIDDFVNDGMWDFFYPFTRSVWAAICSLFFVQCLLAMLFSRSEKNIGLSSTARTFEAMWSVVSLHFRQPAQVRTTLVSGRIWLVTFLFAQCLLIPSLYQTWLLTSLLRIPKFNPYDSVDDALADAASGKYRLALPAIGEHWFEEALEESNLHRYEHFRKNVQKSSIWRTASTLDAVKCVNDGQCIMPVIDGSPGSVLAIAKACDTTSLLQNMPETTVHFVLTKNSTLTEEFNRALAMERPRIINLWRRYMYDIPVREGQTCWGDTLLDGNDQPVICTCT